jgi:hypothetical protein
MVCTPSNCSTADVIASWMLRVDRFDLSCCPADDQLFFLVCAMNPLNCGTTFVPLHVGHWVFAFSCSDMVMVSSNGFWHFSQRNS